MRRRSGLICPAPGPGGRARRDHPDRSVPTTSEGHHERRQPAVLSLRGINKRFGAVQALTDVSPRRAPPARWSPWSATTAPASRRSSRSSSGVYQPDAGEIVFDGTPVLDQRPERPAGRSASRRSSRTSPCATTSTSSPTSSSARSAPRAASSTRSTMETRVVGAAAPALGQDPVGPHPDRRALRRPAPDRRHRPQPGRRAQGRDARRADRGAGRRPDRRGPQPDRAAARAAASASS